MTNAKEFHCHMRTKLQPYEENQICLALFHALVLVLVLEVLCCVVKYNLVTIVVKMILEDTAAFQVLV